MRTRENSRSPRPVKPEPGPGWPQENGTGLPRVAGRGGVQLAAYPRSPLMADRPGTPERDEVAVVGRFEDQDGSPVARAAVHLRFLGDPPYGGGYVFDLEEAEAQTDADGRFRLDLSPYARHLQPPWPAGAWRT